MAILTLEKAAERLSLSPRSLADKRFRVRLGLPAVKLGRKLGFDEDDIAALIARGREVLPAQETPWRPRIRHTPPFYRIDASQTTPHA